TWVAAIACQISGGASGCATDGEIDSTALTLASLEGIINAVWPPCECPSIPTRPVSSTPPSGHDRSAPSAFSPSITETTSSGRSRSACVYRGPSDTQSSAVEPGCGNCTKAKPAPARGIAIGAIASGDPPQPPCE